MRRASPLTASHTGEVVTQKTIMLTDLPPHSVTFWRDLLGGQPNVTLVIRDPEGDLIAASAAAKAKVVVVASSDPTDLEAIDPALGWAANLSILAIASDGRSACIHRIRSETQVLKDLTPQNHCCRGRGPRGRRSRRSLASDASFGAQKERACGDDAPPARLAAILARRWRGDPLYYSARQPYFIMRNHVRMT